VSKHRSVFIKAIEEAMSDTNIGYAQDYAEPGYSVGKGKRGIYFANWNDGSSDMEDLRKGLAEKYQAKTDNEIVDEIEKYAVIEWSDEWTMCDECYKAVRVNPDSYGWRRSFVQEDDCTLVCLECADFAQALPDFINDPDKCWLYDPKYLTEAGFAVLESEDFHAGIRESSEDPRATYKRLKTDDIDIVFYIRDVEQFGMEVEVWTRSAGNDGDSQA
jgi:hypothetical protein